MAVVIKTDDPHDHPLSEREGEYYDTCTGCDREVERSYKFGGVDGKGEEYLFWSMYSCDRRDGGCGNAWSRTTPQGVARDQSRGINPKWPTKAAASGRSYFSGLREDDYDRIFGKKG